MKEDYEFLKKLERSQTLVRVLVAFEDFLDGLDMYAFKNWFKGEVIEGPIIERYWVTVALKFDYRDMPDPSGAKRLFKSGARVKYLEAKQEVYQEEADPILGSQQTANATQVAANKEAEPTHKKVWIVIIELPRRFVEDVIDADLEEFEEYLDVDDVSDARDDGLNDESEFNDDNAESEEEEMELNQDADI